MMETIALETRRWDGASGTAKTEPHHIDPGHVPPSYEHSWALDVADISAFGLAFDDLELAWHLGDHLTVLDSDGSQLCELASAQDVETTIVPVAATPGSSSTRVYLTLHTGPAFRSDPAWHLRPRTFRLNALRVEVCGRDPRATVLDDDIDYETTGAFLDAYYADAFGQLHQPLYPPWASDSIHSPAGQHACPKPRRDEGWHLLGENVRMPSPGFYELLYYNELTSHLRCYLFNIAMSRDVSLFDVEVGLRGKIRGESTIYDPLRGALFPVDPNPKNWSSAHITLPDWPIGTWVSFDIPVLYPMVEKLPLTDDPLYLSYPAVPGAAVKPNAYVSVYEEQLAERFRNITLSTRIRGYQTAVISGDFVGEAAGEALQVFGQTSPTEFKTLATTVSDAIAKGYNWYDSADKFYTKVEDYAKKNPGGVVAGALAPLLSLGAAAFSGPLAAAGVAVSLIGSALFAKPEPIHLSLQLSMHGTFTGKSVSPAQTSEWWFYLPGSFSIEEACATTGLPMQDSAQVAGRLPRYDRTLGHFGYLYNPGRVELDAVANCGQNANYEWEYSTVIVPARQTFDVDRWTTCGLLEAGRGHDPRIWPTGRYDPALVEQCRQLRGQGDLWVGGRPVDCRAVLTEAETPYPRRYLTRFDAFGRSQITEILPIVTNPFAGIVPVTATRLPSGLPSDYERNPTPHECSSLELRVYPSGADSVVECNQTRLFFWPVDTARPEDDPDAGRTCQDSRLNGKQGFAFLVVADPSDAGTEIAPLEYANAYRVGRKGRGYDVTPLNTADDDVRNWYNLWIGTHARPAWDPFPLHDAVMTWELKYWKQPRDGAAPAALRRVRLTAPITYNMLWAQSCNIFWDPETGARTADPAEVAECFEHRTHRLAIESELLRKAGDPYPSA